MTHTPALTSAMLSLTFGLLLHTPINAVDSVPYDAIMQWQQSNQQMTVRASIMENKVVVETDANQDTVVLQSYNALYHAKRPQDYVLIADIDRDGYLDVGAVSGLDAVGEKPCYAMHRFDAEKKQFADKRSFTYCPE